MGKPFDANVQGGSHRAGIYRCVNDKDNFGLERLVYRNNMTAPGESPGYSVWRGAIHKNAGLCQHRPYSYVSRFAIVNKMGQVPISSTTLHRTGLFDGYVDELNITNSTLDEIAGENFKADTIVWDNVTLDGKGGCSKCCVRFIG